MVLLLPLLVRCGLDNEHTAFNKCMGGVLIDPALPVTVSPEGDIMLSNQAPSFTQSDVCGAFFARQLPFHEENPALTPGSD